VEKLKKRGVLVYADKEVGFLIGLIDIFETWTTVKKIERILKYLRMCNCRAGISAQPPAVYSERFREFVEKSVLPIKGQD
jgi:hypothetical protein